MTSYPTGGQGTITMTVPLQNARPEAQPESFLKKYARNLNLATFAGDIDVGIGREQELQAVVTILSKRKKANPILVGKAGTGKSQIVYDLAHKISDPSYAGPLAGKVIWEVSTTSLIAGCSLVGQSEERMQALLNEAQNRPEVILFWDEIHTIVGAGAGSKGYNDLANIVKPAMAGTKLSIIGATTLDEYEIIKYDKALNRRLNKVTVNELSTEDVIEVIKGIQLTYERYHGIMYNDTAEYIVELSDNYGDTAQPDAAIDLLDIVGAMKKNQPDRWSKEGMNVTKEDVDSAAEFLYAKEENSDDECTTLL